MATCWLLEDRLWTKHLEKGPVQVLGAEFSKCLEVFCLSSWRPALISVSCGAHDQRLDVIFHNSIMVGKDKVEACMSGVQYARFAMDRLRKCKSYLQLVGPRTSVSSTSATVASLCVVFALPCLASRLCRPCLKSLHDVVARRPRWLRHTATARASRGPAPPGFLLHSQTRPNTVRRYSTNASSGTHSSMWMTTSAAHRCAGPGQTRLWIRSPLTPRRPTCLESSVRSTPLIARQNLRWQRQQSQLLMMLRIPRTRGVGSDGVMSRSSGACEPLTNLVW